MHTLRIYRYKGYPQEGTHLIVSLSSYFSCRSLLVVVVVVVLLFFKVSSEPVDKYLQLAAAAAC